jgi:hypothetical protein
VRRNEAEPWCAIRDFHRQHSAHLCRDQQGIALETAQFLKPRNPHSMVKVKDLQTGEETVVAFKSE